MGGSTSGASTTVASDEGTDSSMRTDVNLMEDCEGVVGFPIALGAPAHTPQVGAFNDGLRVFFLDSGGAVSAAWFTGVDVPSIESFPTIGGSTLLAGGGGNELAIVVDPGLQRFMGTTDYEFSGPSGLSGDALSHSGIVKFTDTWLFTTLSSAGAFEAHTLDLVFLSRDIDTNVRWIDGDGNAEGAAFVYEVDPPLPTCRVVPFNAQGIDGSESTAASEACNTPTIAYDPQHGGLMAYARESTGQIRAIRIDAVGNPDPDATAHFPIYQGGDADHPELVRLPVSGNYWVVFDQGDQLASQVVDGDSPMNPIGVPKIFGGQADGRLQAAVIDDHPAVAFYTDGGAYDAGVHVIVDCDVQ